VQSAQRNQRELDRQISELKAQVKALEERCEEFRVADNFLRSRVTEEMSEKAWANSSVQKMREMLMEETAVSQAMREELKKAQAHTALQAKEAKESKELREQVAVSTRSFCM
jgi:predicted RNase H-like nuclease (RuvC/YqgF family)